MPGIAVELRQQRAGLIEQARALLDRAHAEKRALTGEDQGAYDKLLTDAEALRARYEAEERLGGMEARLAESLVVPIKPTPAGSAHADTFQERRTLDLRAFIRGERGTKFECRALQADSSTAGGYLVTPERFVAELIKAVDDQVFIRQRATKFPVADAASLGQASLDADPADADWTTELATGGEDSTMAVGKRELKPHPFAKRIKVSADLLGKVPSVEALVRDRLAYKFAITEEKAFLTGNGSGQPLGLFTASASGVSTARDVSTGNTATAFTLDGLKNCYYSVKAQYQARGAWLFHRDAILMLAKLKDGQGQYLWQPSVVLGQPDALFARPILSSEYAPNTFTTGLYVGLYGDFSFYHIADALDISIQRLVELYAEAAQVGFIARASCDGQPVLEEAFARVKLA